MIAPQLAALAAFRARQGAPAPTSTALANGAHLITVPDVDIGPGWTVPRVTVHFLAPPGYPAAQPDCFWVEPTGLRLAGGRTPQNTNDSNPIPADVRPDRRTTWFSWHIQGWNPNSDSLVTFFKVIMRRLKPAR
jgi:hypothetical protein